MTVNKLIKRVNGLSIKKETKSELISLCTSLWLELEQLRSTSEEDELGPWPNRRGLFKRAARVFSEYNREIYSCVSVAFIDLDKFKLINDMYGHKRGDEVIVKVAEIIKASIRGTDVYGRLSGDEFVIILPGSDKKVVKKILQRIKQKFCSTNFLFNTQDIPVSLTFGIVSTKTDGKDFKTLLHKADKLMNAKKGDRSR